MNEKNTYTMPYTCSCGSNKYMIPNEGNLAMCFDCHVVYTIPEEAVRNHIAKLAELEAACTQAKGIG